MLLCLLLTSLAEPGGPPSWKGHPEIPSRNSEMKGRLLYELRRKVGNYVLWPQHTSRKMLGLLKSGHQITFSHALRLPIKSRCCFPTTHMWPWHLRLIASPNSASNPCLWDHTFSKPKAACSVVEAKTAWLWLRPARGDRWAITMPLILFQWIIIRPTWLPSPLNHASEHLYKALCQMLRITLMKYVRKWSRSVCLLGLSKKRTFVQNLLRSYIINNNAWTIRNTRQYKTSSTAQILFLISSNRS